MNSSESWETIPVGHKKAMQAMDTLLRRTDQIMDDLIRARTGSEANSNHAREEHDSILRQIEAQKEKIKQIYQTSDEFTQAVSTLKNAKIFGIPGYTGRKMTLLGNQQNALMRVAEKKKKACDVLYRCQVDELEVQFREEQKKIIEKGRRDLREEFSTSSVQEYSGAVMNYRPDGRKYECPTEMPEAVMLGEIGVSFHGESEEEKMLMELVKTEVETKAEVGSNLVVKLPYAQNLQEGVSLMVHYTPENREYAKNLVQPLMMKMFMSFPAGRLEATMIDPLEMGQSFSDMRVLGEGPNSSRVIDTRIWSQQKDITTAIKTLRDRLEAMVLAYGEDQKSRFQRESVRVLAITDFPANFTDEALNNLHAIVRNSASLGVCVLIFANEQEMNELKERKENLFREIIESMKSVRVENERLFLAEEGYERIFLQLDEMREYQENREKILAYLSDKIEHSRGRVVPFDKIFQENIHESRNWNRGSREEIAIPLGIRGASTVVKLVLGRDGGSTEHHCLISGPTGAGKSTLLHTLIMSAMVTYAPEELRMYLLDFKEGVEFNSYTQYRLPSLCTVAINSEREFGLHVLQELCEELEQRIQMFSRRGVGGINAYNLLPDVQKLPKLLLIFDEVQDLFRRRGEDDSITADCLAAIGRLVNQGRAVGIHLILACQDFKNCAGLEAYFGSMTVRIAIRGTEDGASSILSSDNSGIRTLQDQPAGSAIYNNGAGAEASNNFFQVALLPDEERKELLQCMDAYFTSDQQASCYEGYRTKLLISNAEEDVYNSFNTLIRKGGDYVRPMTGDRERCGLLLGDSYNTKGVLMPALVTETGDNLLIVSRDERFAMAQFELSAMSLLYEELAAGGSCRRTLLYIVDLFDGRLRNGECSFDALREKFPEQVKVEGMRGMERMISELYELMLQRAEGRSSPDERVFLLFCGVNRARTLDTGDIYDRDQCTPLEMLRSLLTKGPKYGINSIVWGESSRGIQKMLGAVYLDMFHKRIAYGLDDEDMAELVAEETPKLLNGKTAVYLDIYDIRNTHFRPYEIPAEDWVEQYAQAYRKARDGMDQKGGKQP